MTQTFAFWIGIIVALVVAVLVLTALFPNASFLGARIDPNDVRDVYYRCLSNAQDLRDDCQQNASEYLDSCFFSTGIDDADAGNFLRQCRERYLDLADHCDASYDSELEACHEDAYGTGF